MGTKVSTQSSFANGLDVKANVSIGLGSQSALGFGGDFSVTQTTTDTNSETFNKSLTTEYKAVGNKDGINHDQDVFLIMLNPAIMVQQTPAYSNGLCGKAVDWNMGVNPALGVPTASIYELYVGWLKTPANMPAGVSAQLKALNFTSADYKTILALDPFVSEPLSIIGKSGGGVGLPVVTLPLATGPKSASTTLATTQPAFTIAGVAIDPNRFIPTTQTFPYEPPNTGAGCNNNVCTCPAITATLTNDFATDVGQQVQTQYKVSETGSLSGLTAGIFSFGSSVSFNQTWTSSSTEDDTTDSSQSAAFTLQCPSPSYTSAQTSMAMYWDKLFGSFMFAPIELGAFTNVLSQGNVIGNSGKPIPHTPVSLTLSGKTFRTYTNNEGKFAFVAPPTFVASGTGQLSSGGATTAVRIGQTQNIKTAQ